MRLENLYSNFGKSPPEEQEKFVAEYRLRRAQDLAAIPPTTSRKTTSGIKSKIDLSDEEKAVMKMLGLKQKDILALRASIEVEEISNDKELFKDDLYEEEDVK